MPKERQSSDLANPIPTPPRPRGRPKKPNPLPRGRPRKTSKIPKFNCSIPNELDPEHPHIIDLKLFRTAFFSHLLIPGNSEFNFSFPPLLLHEVRQVLALFPQFFGPDRLSLYNRFQTVSFLSKILQSVPSILSSSSSDIGHLSDTISFLDYASALIKNSSDTHSLVRSSSFPVPDFGQYEQDNLLAAKSAKLRDDSDYLKSLHQDVKLNCE